MNEFQRRLLDVAENASFLANYANKNRKVVNVEYFGYPTQLDLVAAGASAQSTVQIQSDSDFVLTYLSGAVNQGGVVNPLATIQITDTGSGKTFMSQPTRFGLVMGSNGFPFLLPSPKVLAPNTNIRFDVTNLDVVIQTFYIVMFGARIYYAD